MPKSAKEEKELLESFEKSEWTSVKRMDSESKRYREYARSAFLKDRRVNIRISTKDLEGVRKNAVEEGIPCHTLISGVIHKFVSNRLVEMKS